VCEDDLDGVSGRTTSATSTISSMGMPAPTLRSLPGRPSRRRQGRPDRRRPAPQTWEGGPTGSRSANGRDS